MGTKNTTKNIVGQSFSILKATNDNLKVLMDKKEQGRKDHGCKELKDDQGPNKHTRTRLKKSKVMKDRELDESWASIENMIFLADQDA